MTNHLTADDNWKTSRGTLGSKSLQEACELFMESRVRLKHLQRAHPVRTLHVEPEAQVTQADAGRKRTLGGHLGDVAVPLGGGVNVQEFPITTFEHRRHDLRLSEGAVCF